MRRRAPLIASPDLTTLTSQTMKTVQRIALGLAGAAVLLVVAASYLNPHLMLDLADKLWACF